VFEIQCTLTLLALRPIIRCDDEFLDSILCMWKHEKVTEIIEMTQYYAAMCSSDILVCSGAKTSSCNLVVSHFVLTVPVCTVIWYKQYEYSDLVLNAW